MIQIMVFDKTGTLTEDGLQMMGVKSTLGQIGNLCNFADFVERI